MAATLLSLAPSNSSNTTFRAWGSAISAQLATAGLVNTSDTGQINWTTVTAPAANTAAGYEIWRFSDSLQSTYPVYFKLEYGTALNATAHNPQLWLTVGTGSDGAGNITAAAGFPNTIGTRNTLLYNTTSDWSSTNNFPLWIDSDGGGSLMIGGWLGVSVPNAAGFIVVIERTRNWDGTFNGEGVAVMGNCPNNSSGTGISFFQCIPLANAQIYSSVQITNWKTIGGGLDLKPTSNPAHTAVVNNVLYVFPVFTGFTPKMNGPSKHVIGIFSADAAGNAQFNATLYGVAHSFVACGQNFGGIEQGATGLAAAFKIS